jgi:aldehyde:ferredoxin oxidoreductase
MMKSGERAWNLKRVVNNRLGLTRANDRLPKALLEPHTDVGAARFVPDLAAMLDAYYEARGWDRETGRPARDKLTELGLGEMAEELWKKQVSLPVAEDSVTAK